MLDGGMNRLVAHRKASDAVRHHERLERRPPEGPGPQGLLWSGQPKLSRRAMSGRPACGSCRRSHSASPGRQKFNASSILYLASRAGLATIYRVPRGSLLNLLWLGRKMHIFRDRPTRALWISGNGPRKAPVGQEIRLVSGPWHRVEQKQNKPSQNGQ